MVCRVEDLVTEEVVNVVFLHAVMVRGIRRNGMGSEFA